MPAIDFPNSPAVDDTFTVGSITWKWNGSTWESVPAKALGTDDIDGGDAVSWYTWLDLKVDNSDANEKIADGSYVDGGSAVI
jgi:hypothetical protein